MGFNAKCFVFICCSVCGKHISIFAVDSVVKRRRTSKKNLLRIQMCHVKNKTKQ